MNVCIIGESKTGKTYALNTLQGHTVLFSFDPEGYESLRLPYTKVAPGQYSTFTWPDELTHVAVIDYCSMPRTITADVTSTTRGHAATTTVGRGDRAKEQEEVFKAFVADANFAAYDENVNHTCLDSLTTFSEIVLGWVLSANKRKLLTQEDWGQAISKVEEVISILCGAPTDFILNCHIQVEKDELVGRLKEGPLIFGKRLPGVIPAYFSTVFQTGYSNGYYWETKPQPLMQTIGSRAYDTLPERIHQNFQDLLNNTARSAKPTPSK